MATPSDSLRLKELIADARLLMMRQPDSAYLKLEEAHLLAEYIPDYDGLATVLVRMYGYHSFRNEWDMAYNKLQEAYILCEEKNLKRSMVYVCNHFSSYYIHHMQLDSSFVYLSQATRLAETLQDTIVLSLTTFNWVTYLYSVKDTAAAGEKIARTIELIEQHSKPTKNYRYYLYAAIDHFGRTGEQEKRAVFLEKYLNSATENSYINKNTYERYHRNVLLLGYKGTPEQRLTRLENDFALHRANDHPYGVFYSAIFLGDEFAKRGELKIAEQYYQFAHELKYTQDRNEFILFANKKLADFYQLSGQSDKALDHYLTYHTLYDSLYHLDRIQAAKELETKFETAEKEKQIAQQELQINQQQIEKNKLIYGLIGLGILAFLIGVFLLYRVRTNRQLKNQNSLIQRTLDEKELLLKEIHHRVKNNLQVVSGLLNWQASFIKDNEVLNAFNEGQNRVQSMAIIHQKLYQTDNLTGIEMEDYIKRLSQSLFRSYNIKQEQIDLKTDIEALQLDIDTVIPLGLILNELISNALKHAFPGKRQGEVAVKMYRDESSEELYLSVKDNGVGIGEKKSLVKDSFGWELVETLAQKLKAQLDIVSDQGTHVQLRIRNFKMAA